MTTTASHLLTSTTTTAATRACPLIRPIQTPKTTQSEIKVYKLFKPVKELSQKMTSTDCGDKVCSLRHQFLKDCFLFIHTNSTECNIPCHLEGCRKELHHAMNCPIWDCNPITTTTTSTTTTVTPTTTPEPIPMPTSSTSILLYISLGLNLALIFVGLIWYAYWKYSRRTTYQPIEEVPMRRLSLLSNDNRFFSVGSDSESNAENTQQANMADLAGLAGTDGSTGMKVDFPQT